MIRVMVAGAGGRMGSEVVHAVAAAEGMQLVAAVDPTVTGCLLEGGVKCIPDLASAIAEFSPDVMVDFTHPSSVEANLRIALTHGVHCVVGTTGLTNETLDDIASAAVDGACLFYAPNFAIGAVLMMSFAQRAAKYLPHAEIVELHHDQKADAPSGTAVRTAALIASARSERPETPGAETELPGMQGARGATVDGVHVHSIRLSGLVAHQEVIFGGPGQTLTIRHDSLDRTSFMPGVILAIREVGSRSGLVVGLENLMGE
ncbi:MAG: 4-hydroxy-tetrahydrodipicolinate reductase [Coriobacteriia bacterium]|nr:4-hydroxy-tetrahydrodipicolinate reductase [Coriobacteriia bacterium]